MESFTIIVMYVAVAAIGFARRDRSADGSATSLCLTCVNPMIARGTRGEERIACTYAGALRPVTFTVCDCTGYCSTPNTSRLVKIEGFTREQREVYTQVAIS
jgi:hypothetical protein